MPETMNARQHLHHQFWRCYALVSDPDDDQPDINVIKRWPHGAVDRYGTDKVPSYIAYIKSGTPVGYGFKIPLDVQPLQWVKLLLEPEHFSGPQKTPSTERVWRSYEELERLDKRPVDVIADYLAWLFARIQEYVKEHEDDLKILEHAKVTVVMTVPASWSDRAKDCLRQAARQGGIESPGRLLKFRAELEAAAIFELKAKAKKGQVKDGDCVIICDAGGGTVDVVTYRVRSRKPLTLDQVVLNFDRLGTSVVAQIRQDFEYKIKRTYDLEAPSTYYIPVTGMADDEQRAIYAGRLKVDDAVLQAAFDSVMTQIMTLIDNQKDGLKEKGLEDSLKGTLVVGGFDGSEFLHTRIRQEYPEVESVRVWRGDQSWTAVVQGAVAGEATIHESHNPVKSRLSSYNYGIPYQQATSRKVQWPLRKGQAIQTTSHSEPFALRMEDQPWLDEDTHAIILVQLIKTGDDHVDENLGTTAEPLVEISCRVPTSIRKSALIVQRNPLVWRIPAELVIMMDGPELSVRCRIKGEDVGAVALKYYDETPVALRPDWNSSNPSVSSRPSDGVADSVINVSSPSIAVPPNKTSAPSNRSTKHVVNARAFGQTKPWLFEQTTREKSRQPSSDGSDLVTSNIPMHSKNEQQRHRKLSFRS